GEYQLKIENATFYNAHIGQRELGIEVKEVGNNNNNVENNNNNNVENNNNKKKNKNNKIKKNKNNNVEKNKNNNVENNNNNNVENNNNNNVENNNNNNVENNNNNNVENNNNNNVENNNNNNVENNAAESEKAKKVRKVILNANGIIEGNDLNKIKEAIKQLENIKNSGSEEEKEELKN